MATGDLALGQEQGAVSAQKHIINDFSIIVAKEEDQPVNVHAGFIYKILQKLSVSGGIQSSTTSFYAGVGISFKTLRLDICSSYHPQLGITPGLMIQFQFNREQK